MDFMKRIEPSAQSQISDAVWSRTAPRMRILFSDNLYTQTTKMTIRILNNATTSTPQTPVITKNLFYDFTFRNNDDLICNL